MSYHERLHPYTVLVGKKRRYLALIDCFFYGMMLNRTFVMTKSVGMMFNITLYFIETFSRN